MRPRRPALGGGWPADSSLLFLVRSLAPSRPMFTRALLAWMHSLTIECGAKSFCILIAREHENLINVMFPHVRQRRRER